MTELQNIAKKLFDDGSINLLIGYSDNENGGTSAIFIDNSADVDKLIYNENCHQNLMVYFLKPEVKKFGKLAFVVSLPGLKSVLEIASENQIKDGDAYFIAIDKDGNPSLLQDFHQIEDFITNNQTKPPMGLLKLMEKINNMTREERWQYWTDEFSKCIKCYACRSVCPLCYCTQCITDINIPQWISTESSPIGNLDWHIARAMHLAGRCIGCGECMKACPVDIPLALLTANLNKSIAIHFGDEPGMKADYKYPLSHYKLEDKENFIR